MVFGLMLAWQMVAAPPPVSPQSLAETAAMRTAASLEESTRAAGGRLLTTAERSQFQETGSYEEAVAFYRQLEKASPYARLIKIGESAEGRPLYVLICSKDRAFTAAAARRTAKPVVLLQNGIHAGENGGKDAAMMLLRDVLVTHRHAAWLDKVIILSIPVFNADGHERISPYNRINENGPAKMGFRVTSTRLNLNRDYIKADTPEMRAWLSLYRAWLPDLLIDNHVTDGGDAQYDATLAANTEQDIAPQVGAWVKQHYMPELMAGLDKLGHVTGFYLEGRGPQAAVMTATPRYSTGYAAAQNRAALLIETHSLKSFKTRVWSHYDIMKLSLDLAGAKLRQASLDADRAQAAVKPGDRVFLEGKPGGAPEPYTLKQVESVEEPSPVSGGPVRRYTGKAVNVETTIRRGLDVKFAPAAPAGYLVPRQWSGVIAVLKAHGIEMEALPRPITAEFDVLKFENAHFAPMPFEGRFQVVSFVTKAVRQRQTVEAGSVWVPVAQRAGKLAMQILEPEAPDSALKWGFFQPIFEQKEYFSDFVFEPYARQMLAADPKLKAEFEALKETSPRARLQWLYRRSPYYEADKDVYPVLRLDHRPW